MRKFTIGFGFALMMISSPVIAAPVNTPSGTITFLTVGLNDALMRVQLNIPFYNPHSCSTTDGYIVDTSSPGYSLFQATLLSARAQNQTIYLTIDGCILGRPKVIGVSVL